MNNYPPGVTGRELDIAGPDWDDDNYWAECPGCGFIGEGFAQGYGFEARWTCPACGGVMDWDQSERDFWDRADAAYDEYRDRLADENC